LKHAFGGTKGTFTFGATTTTTKVDSFVALKQDTRRPMPPAWIDTPNACFKLGGAVADPACMNVNFDTGANFAVIYQTKLPSTGVDMNGFLTSASTFEVSGTGFDVVFTPGMTASKDEVRLETTSPGYANLGVEIFFRMDVLYDAANGRLGFTALP
jgi:hypothetical protein